MLFLQKDGHYIEILRKNYTTDVAYYTAIMRVKGYVAEPPKPVRLFL